MDDFLRVATPREILSHAGKVSHKIALDKARLEYQKYQELLKSEDLSLVEQHFQQVIQEVKKIETDESEIRPNELSHR